MPGPGSKTPAETGISDSDIDIAALVQRLREEISGANGPARDRNRAIDARHRAERIWSVTAERPLERRPGLKGLVAYPVKRVLQPFLRWYVEPLAAEQRMFNDAVLKLTDGILEEIGRAHV